MLLFSRYVLRIQDVNTAAITNRKGDVYTGPMELTERINKAQSMALSRNTR